MSFWNHYPYTDFHELNLDWIINILREMEKKLENFVATNSIKYANPFQWSIVNQYEKNTLVIEPNTGTAYLSVQAVPQGVNISNTDYWTPVFDLSTLFVDINKNFTGHDEQLNVYSSANYSVGDWLLWKNKLYKVITAIQAGEAFAVGTNIEQITIESVIDDINTAIDAINAELVIIRNAKTSFNSVSEMIADIDADNATHATTSGYYNANDGGGAHYIIRDIEGTDVVSATVDGTTSAQGLVRLNNTKCAELVSDVVNVLQYGAKADGVTPCNVLIDSIITYNRAHGIKKNVYFPAGNYYFSIYLQSIRQETAVLPILDLEDIEIYGDGKNSIIHAYDADIIQLNGVSNLRIHDLALTGSVPAGVTYGLNGISMTNGTHDIEIYRVHAFDLPVYVSTYADGSKAFTCQTGNTSPGSIYNISVHDCTCDNCAYGFEASFYSLTDARLVKNINVSNNIFNCYYDGLAFNGSCDSSSEPLANNVIFEGNICNGCPLGIGLSYSNGVKFIGNVFTFGSTIDPRISGVLSNVVGASVLRCILVDLSHNVFNYGAVRSYIEIRSAYVGECKSLIVDGNVFNGVSQASTAPINTYRYDDVEGAGYPEQSSFVNNKAGFAGAVCASVIATPSLNNYIFGQVTA